MIATTTLTSGVKASPKSVLGVDRRDQVAGGKSDRQQHDDRREAKLRCHDLAPDGQAKDQTDTDEDLRLLIVHPIEGETTMGHTSSPTRVQLTSLAASFTA